MIQVSVITAAYESLDTLPRTVDSVKGQSGVSVEHIVVDGGSSDGTQDWLDKALPRDSWISEKDEGIGDAMNKGARLARGKWLLFLQADDRLISRDCLAKALEAWDGVSDVVSSPIRFESGRLLRPRVDRAYYRYFKQGVPHQGALIQRKAFARVGEYDARFRVTMDFDWFLRAHWLGLTFQVLPEPLCMMSEAGVSSLADWNSLRHRFSEERLSRRLRAPSRFWKGLYGIYGVAYAGFRYVWHRLGAQ
ncbi:glycosyltransferase family 2 protein [Pelagicoccus sp. SDUM812003]|uniref:glycosyltransferase family 2 protein n=1 Tax=Pelagicoccus sp. SDUM812003 TaxID=3041267 RepID=UPI00280D0424|nr:glycosyltransferase family 2 protein [Pelagicoccus sp. SDUM812003]MDQ8202373.1 glycosyltransferase family 2 protein [Pelagicoccus sp. SDUM812003]